MKVYVTDEKELIMEPLIKWAGNPNVTVAVKAFGLKATVQVVIFSCNIKEYLLTLNYLCWRTKRRLFVKCVLLGYFR